jgi:hypothetical protein
MNHKKHIVKSGQDLLDVAAFYYGDSSLHYLITRDPRNDSILQGRSVSAPIGSEIFIPSPETGDPEVRRYWEKTKREPANLAGTIAPGGGWFEASGLFNGINTCMCGGGSPTSWWWDSHHQGQWVFLVKPYPFNTKPDAHPIYSIYTAGSNTTCNTQDIDRYIIQSNGVNPGAEWDRNGYAQQRGCAFSGGDGTTRIARVSQITYQTLINKWGLFGHSSNGSRQRFSHNEIGTIPIDMATDDNGFWIADYSFRKGTGGSEEYYQTIGVQRLARAGVGNNIKEHWFWGLMGYIALYDRELSDAEFAELYAGGDFADPRTLDTESNILSMYIPGESGGVAVYGSEKHDFSVHGVLDSSDDIPFSSIQ